METASPTLSRKAQIDQTATALFRRRGYAATSMRELAAALGIEAGSIYSHIRSKEEILHRICFRLADEFMAGWRNATADASAPVATQLRRAIESHVRVLIHHVDASAVFMHEWRHLSEPAHGEFLQLRHGYEVGFRELIARGVAAGELHTPDPAFAALTLLASLAWLPSWYRPDGKLGAEQIAERLADQLLGGLAN
ncbi:TetR/AcrR family transcriptional regulator [Hymenobacter busanensis]|uniref:TetR/AcrR family transcriptional regulator n=1 Tax=Hymenobacter busanensis TaxID=2607656 RepID=A0A7L4ZUN0_9BACT|nr:TetR/AcrR family transcriptional regulator [Hymenobacter busanensis]KAA9327215.1 TetR/AcrR family transcriptional regulator [Hymenobacter busanensis]QHJ05882.1 TetR family transcriptional regulator [Hymenobacter busanensis]